MNVNSRLIYIPVGRAEIQGDLHIPYESTSIVVFAHGSGSSRHSPRNKYVAGLLNDAGLATLLIDLLTPDEELIDFQTTRLRFDIDLLADRLITVTHWLHGQPATEKLHLGYFGASTGAAAALVAAGRESQFVEAIVSRGGRPDLAGPWLKKVQAPTRGAWSSGTSRRTGARLVRGALDSVQSSCGLVTGGVHVCCCRSSRGVERLP
jgi:putative phosphoribosyl transferase